MSIPEISRHSPLRVGLPDAARLSAEDPRAAEENASRNPIQDADAAVVELGEERSAPGELTYQRAVRRKGASAEAEATAGERTTRRNGCATWPRAAEKFRATS